MFHRSPRGGASSVAFHRREDDKEGWATAGAARRWRDLRTFSSVRLSVSVHRPARHRRNSFRTLRLRLCRWPRLSGGSTTSTPAALGRPLSSKPFYLPLRAPSEDLRRPLKALRGRMEGRGASPNRRPGSPVHEGAMFRCPVLSIARDRKGWPVLALVLPSVLIAAGAVGRAGNGGEVGGAVFRAFHGPTTGSEKTTGKIHIGKRQRLCVASVSDYA